MCYLGHILTHDRLNMNNETLHHLAIMYVNKMDESGNVMGRSSNMTAHEMILLCSSLQGVGRCIPLCLVLGSGFCHLFSLWKIWLHPTNSLKHE